MYISQAKTAHRVDPGFRQEKRKDARFSGIIFLTEVKILSRAENYKYFCDFGRSRTDSQSHYNRRFNSESSDMLVILYRNRQFRITLFEGRSPSQKYF